MLHAGTEFGQDKEVSGCEFGQFSEPQTGSSHRDMLGIEPIPEIAGTELLFPW